MQARRGHQDSIIRGSEGKVPGYVKIAGVVAFGGTIAALVAVRGRHPVDTARPPLERTGGGDPGIAARTPDPSPVLERAVLRAARKTAQDAGGETEAVTVSAPRPIATASIALAHEEGDQDFLEIAKSAAEAGDLEDALVALRKHIYTHAPTLEVLIDIGRIARQTGEHSIAEEALLGAAALDPASADIQVELTRVLLDRGDAEAARHHARQAIRLDTENGVAWNLAGRIAMKESQWARAESALRRAVELDPTNAMVHNNLGLLYIYTRKPQDAVDSLETAVELFAGDTPYFVYNNLGLAHELAGDFEEARDAFEEALTRNPSYARANVNLKRVLRTIAVLEEKSSFKTAKGAEAPPTGEETPALRP